MIAIALLLVTAAAPDPSQVERFVLEQTNAYRESQGVHALRPEARLSKVAREFASTLAKRDELEHDAGGSTIDARILKGGYRPCAWAENIVYEYRSREFTAQELATAFVKDWRESSGHRRNMLSRDVKDIGIGVARSERTGRLYGVQVFARECR